MLLVEFVKSDCYLLLSIEHSPKAHFRYIKIQLNGVAQRTQTTEMNEHDIQFPLFSPLSLSS